MECVEGETLVTRLEKGPLRLEQIWQYAAQIASALEKAHRSGIVHSHRKTLARDNYNKSPRTSYREMEIRRSIAPSQCTIGWYSPKMLAHYSHVRLEAKRKALERIP
jgi:hypothetical protein